MKNLIRKILKESIDNRKLNYGLSLIEKGRVEPPYDKDLGLLGFDYDEIKEILGVFIRTKLKDIKNIQPPYFKQLSKYVSEDIMELILSPIFKEPITISSRTRTIMNKNNDILYHEYYNGSWVRYEYDDIIGKEIYYEKSDGSWERKKYNYYGKVIYRENSDGIWERWEYDKNGKLIYNENSNDGVIIDKR